MKSFRRSKRLSNSLLTSSPKHILRVLLTSHPDVDIIANSPTKVIKALYDYKPQGPRELQFNKGDFFHVLSDETLELDQQGWYEATNPMSNQRGMVPKLYFEVFNRSMHALARGNEIDQLNPIFAKIQQQQSLQNIQQRTIQNISQYGAQPRENRTLYAVTLYDFRAEREDELDIVPGEHLVICAHHDYEWFIAKPINRLGGPGLVPASYVRIVDKYNPQAQMDAAGDDMVAIITHFKIPTVEEWKEQTAVYQASTKAPYNASGPDPSQYAQTVPVTRSSSTSSGSYIVEASVDSYHLTENDENSRHQYVVTARTLTGKVRVLFRFYEEFYNTQVKLLEQHPYEAGKVEGSKRTIPGFPGPVVNVSENIVLMRRELFDVYLKKLIALPPHISRSDCVMALFEVHNNGYDKEYSENEPHSRPIHQQSGYHQERISQYSNVLPNTKSRSSNTPSTDSNSYKRALSPGANNSLAHQPSVENKQYNSENKVVEKQPKVKVKFYFQDDIFVLLLPVNLRLQDLKTKLADRLELRPAHDVDPASLVSLFLRTTFYDFMDDHQIATEILTEEQEELLFQNEITDDATFHDLLHDKCKIVIFLSSRAKALL